MEGIVDTDLLPAVEEFEITSHGMMELEPPEEMDFGSSFGEDGSAIGPPPSIPRWKNFRRDGSAIRPPPSIPRWKNFKRDGSAIRPPPSIPRWEDFGRDGSAIKPPSISRWMDFRTSAGGNDIALVDWMNSELDRSDGEDDGTPPKGMGSKSDPTSRGGDGSTTSSSWSLTYEEQVHNLKENWKKALNWNSELFRIYSFHLKSEKLIETSPWFASVVAQLRVDPCRDSCKFESDQSPLREFVTGVKMTSLDLAILMGDRKMVRKIFKRCTSTSDEILRGPIIDRKRASELSSSLGISLDHKKTHFIYTPLHLAVEGGDSLILCVLLHFGADVNAQNWQGQTPLDRAYKMENETILRQLLEKDIERKDLLHLAMLHQDVYSRKELPISPNVNALDSHGRTPLHYLATRHSLKFDFMKYILHYLARDRTLDVKALDSRGFSPFYVAILYCNTRLVILLLDFFKDQIRLNEACNQDLGPPIQIAFEGGDDFKDIERALMECDPVKGYMDNLYRDRQVYVDAANAILVGAALIASVTFASWLQPPLNYTSYSGEGYSSSVRALATSDLNFVDVEHNIPLRAFWVFNALSFYFSITAVVCGA